MTRRPAGRAALLPAAARPVHLAAGRRVLLVLEKTRRQLGTAVVAVNQLPALLLVLAAAEPRQGRRPEQGRAAVGDPPERLLVLARGQETFADRLLLE